MSEAHNESLKRQIVYTESLIYQYIIKIQHAKDYIKRLERELCPDT